MASTSTHWAPSNSTLTSLEKNGAGSKVTVSTSSVDEAAFRSVSFLFQTMVKGALGSSVFATLTLLSCWLA